MNLALTPRGDSMAQNKLLSIIFSWNIFILHKRDLTEVKETINMATNALNHANPTSKDITLTSKWHSQIKLLHTLSQ